MYIHVYVCVYNFILNCKNNPSSTKSLCIAVLELKQSSYYVVNFLHAFCCRQLYSSCYISNVSSQGKKGIRSASSKKAHSVSIKIN